MKSTLLNMVLVLFGITLVASAGVGAVNMLTEGAIKEAEENAKNAALLAVLPEFNDKTQETVEVDGRTAVVYTALAADKSVVGYAVEATSPKGFSGDVVLMVGFTPEGKIRNVNVLKQTETPGLGTKMTEEGNNLIKSVKDVNPANMKLVDGHIKVVKDSGSVDALTAATISSRAYTDALDCAWAAYKIAASNGTSVEETAAEEIADAEAEQTVTEEGGNNEE